MENGQNVEVIKVENRVEAFLKAFSVKNILRHCNITKRHGASPFNILLKITQLPFAHQSFYHDLIAAGHKGLRKDTIYALLNSPYYNWRRFLLTLCTTIISKFFMSLTSEWREKVLIVDFTIYARARSKCTELLSRVYDHVLDRFLKGFRLLTLGWSDGSSFLPTDFALMASSDPENLINGINEKIHKNTNGYKRRREALKKATENVVDMVARALQFGINADYVLMDSWFCFPVLIESLKNLRRSLHVICMLKDLPSIRFRYRGRSLRLGELYAVVPKHRGRAIVKASVIVKIAAGLRVRIIFVKHRHKQEWLAILSTNLNIDDEEIIRIYGKRWDIEVFFKVVKSYLHLAKEIQAKSYDALIAHTTIVFTRYLLLSCQQRQAIDERTLDGVFRACVQELKDLTLAEAINRLIAFVIERLREHWQHGEKLLDEIIDALMSAAAALFLKGELMKTES
jgi:hypothetical protein